LGAVGSVACLFLSKSAAWAKNSPKIQHPTAQERQRWGWAGRKIAERPRQLLPTDLKIRTNTRGVQVFDFSGVIPHPSPCHATYSNSQRAISGMGERHLKAAVAATVGAADLYDLSAQIDRSLTYSENRQLLESAGAIKHIYSPAELWGLEEKAIREGELAYEESIKTAQIRRGRATDAPETRQFQSGGDKGKV
jgi:hypothetical protein